jgi:hypothetical protein
VGFRSFLMISRWSSAYSSATCWAWSVRDAFFSRRAFWSVRTERRHLYRPNFNEYGQFGWRYKHNVASRDVTTIRNWAYGYGRELDTDAQPVFVRERDSCRCVGTIKLRQMMVSSVQV